MNDREGFVTISPDLWRTIRSALILREIPKPFLVAIREGIQKQVDQ